MLSENAEPVTRFGGDSPSHRLVGRSILRGIGNCCPACGSGRLFRAYLKPVDHCAACGEEIFHQRSDDLPPYIVITILGHVLVGGYMMTDMIYPLSTWAYLAIWIPLGILTSVLTIQPVKGGVIGLQWALRMHGFGDHDDDGPEEFGPKKPDA